MLFDIIIRKDARIISISTAQRRDGEDLAQFRQRIVHASRTDHLRRTGEPAGTRDALDVEQIGGCLAAFVQDVYGSQTLSAELTATVTADHKVGTYEGGIETYFADTNDTQPRMVARFYARQPVNDDEPGGDRLLAAA